MKSNNVLIRSFRHTLIGTLLGLFIAGCAPKESESTGQKEFDGGILATKHTPCIVVSTTDLKGIVEVIGSDAVELHCFGKGNQDPHILNILPSYVRQMNEANLWVQVGSDIEAGWYPDLVANLTNPTIEQGSEGFLDLAGGIMKLEGTVGNLVNVGQKSGLHALGNPHYMLDPIEGIRAAKQVADRLGALFPELKERSQQNFEVFRKRIADALIGKQLAEQHDVIEIADLYLNDDLTDFLANQDHGVALGGWLGQLSKHRGTVIVGDHDLWPYFARRVGLAVLGYFEPEPGVTPTTKHLGILVKEMKRRSVGLIFSAPYFDPRHARFISKNTGAKILPMCHQTQARPGANSYFDMVRHNMETLIAALDEE